MDRPEDLTSILSKSLGRTSEDEPAFPKGAAKSIAHITGLEDGYFYSELIAVPEETLRRYCSGIKATFRAQVDDKSAREEWMVRTHVAVKLVLSATVMLTSALYAAAERLRIVEPYLIYYALFNTSRALVLLVPEERWKDGAILNTTTHSKVLNVTTDRLRLLSPEMSKEYRKLAPQALAAREFFSYKFPARGAKGEAASLLPNFEDILRLCRFIGETAHVKGGAKLDQCGGVKVDQLNM